MKLRNNRGFTLAELMIVVAIIGIGVTMAVTSYYKYLPHIRLKAAARDIASSLNIARMKTIAFNYKSGTVSFNINNDSFTTSYVDVNNILISDPVNSSSNRGWNNTVDIWWGGVGGKYAVPAFTGGAVSYNSFGSTQNLDPADNEYAVYLINKPAVAGDEYRVKVNRLTGKVTVEHFGGVDLWSE
jgi:prepilin-type N-terminal cleavage/methylation domain-containing protein